MPRFKSLRWLADAGNDVPEDVRLRLISILQTSFFPLVLGGLSSAAVDVVAAIRHPTAAFITLVTADVVLLFVRSTIVLWTHRAAARGHLHAPDLFLVSSITWTALVGVSSAFCIASLDPVLQFLGPTTMMGIVAGIVTRNNCAPRLAILQVALCDIPLQVAIPFCGQPWLFISIAQCPLFLAGMAKTIFGLSRAYLAMVMARHDSEERATHDPLTGLWNRSGLMLALAAPSYGRRINAERIALLYVDLDGFKAVNDQLGHAAGDDVIRQAAVRITESVPEAALVARVGGDEFIVVVPGHDGHGGLAIGDAIILAVSQPFEFDAHSVPPLGASIGIACSERSHSPDELVAEADAALYVAKNAGKGRCVLADPSDRTRLALPRRAA